MPRKNIALRLNFVKSHLVLICMASLLAATVQSRQLTLDEATDVALNNTSRGSIIVGKREVAEQTYNARRINFLVPEISINGRLPSYSVDESFRLFIGGDGKQLYKTRDISFNTFVELKQSLITGGNLTVTADLVADNSKYPQAGEDVKEIGRQGSFKFALDQPLFRPSATKKELHDKRDDMGIARMAEIEEGTALRKEVTEAYLGLMIAKLSNDIQTDKLSSSRLKATIDSSKFSDGIVSEETWLTSSSELLDSELEHVDVETKVREQSRELASLLDLKNNEQIETVEPTIDGHYDEIKRTNLVNSWENTIAIKKADFEYRKSLRDANFSASGHGITGDISASYSLGKGKIESEFANSSIIDNIDTRGWGLSLNVKLPVWDGGAGSAAVKAARFGADQALLELERARKDARAEITSLINDLDVGYRRLDVIRRQIELAQNRLQIAHARFDDGQISEINFLEAKIFHRTQQNRYLEELKQYLLNRIELEGRFVEM